MGLQARVWPGIAAGCGCIESGDVVIPAGCVEFDLVCREVSVGQGENCAVVVTRKIHFDR